MIDGVASACDGAHLPSNASTRLPSAHACAHTDSRVCVALVQADAGCGRRRRCAPVPPALPLCRHERAAAVTAAATTATVTAAIATAAVAAAAAAAIVVAAAKAAATTAAAAVAVAAVTAAAATAATLHHQCSCVSVHLMWVRVHVFCAGSGPET